MNIVNEEVQRIKTLTELFVSSPRNSSTRPQSAHINIKELTNLKAELKIRARQFQVKANQDQKERMLSPRESRGGTDKSPMSRQFSKNTPMGEFVKNYDQTQKKVEKQEKPKKFIIYGHNSVTN